MGTADPQLVSDQVHTHAGARHGLARSVLANWAWYSVVIVSGFVVPRMIADHRGPQLLGVWDFGWSLVVYVSFLAFGITSAVNRYVARYRTTGDWASLNRVANSSLLILSVCSVAGIGLALVFRSLVPVLLTETDPYALSTAGWLVLLLAGKSALQLPAGVFNGIITGYERFDLLNAIRITRDLGILACVVCLLIAGHGLLSLGVTVFCAELLASAAKLLFARRICPHLRWSVRLCRRTTIRKLVSFGGKTFVQSLAQGGIYQGSSLIVAAFLGPVPLAIYARQRALVLNAMRFLKQYAQVFIPRSSSLQAGAGDEALREMLVTTTRYGLFISLPIMMVLVIMGGPLLRLWMGPEFEAPLVLAIMAIGHALYIPQMGLYSVLMGMGKHGIPALLELAAAVIGVSLGLLLLGVFHAGLIAAAIAMTVPLTVTGGVLLPWYACRELRIGYINYLLRAFPGPFFAILPLAACLLTARIVLTDNSLASLTTGVVSGGLATLIVYGFWVLPATLRSRIMGLLAQRLGLKKLVTSTVIAEVEDTLHE